MRDGDSPPPTPSPAVTPSDEPPFPRQGRLAGVDFGTVRIGIAVCDPLRILVSPLEIRQVSDPQRDGEYFRQLAVREAIDGFVVGLPIHCDGGESEKSVAARRFARWLSESTAMPVRLFDERFTTSAAQSRARSSQGGSQRGFKGGGKRSRQRRVDAIAAQVLLESYLEASKYRDELPGQSPTGPATGEAALD